MAAFNFKWRDGKSRSVDPNIVGQRIQQLEQGGVASAQAIVNDARPISSELHPLFQWDDSVAAEGYRRDQARDVAQNLRLIIQEDPQQVARETLAFISVSAGPQRGYASTMRVALDDDWRAQAISDALRQLQAWTRRYESITDLQDVMDTVKEALDREERNTKRRESYRQKKAVV